jgi:predicted dehydrogenase
LGSGLGLTVRRADAGAILTRPGPLLEARLRRRPNVSRARFERQLEDFARAVPGGAAVGATADDGLRVLRVLAACRER